MYEFKVGDRVRVKDNVSPDGWLQPGEEGVIDEITPSYHTTAMVATFYKEGDESQYYAHEIEPSIYNIGDTVEVIQYGKGVTVHEMTGQTGVVVEVDATPGLDVWYKVQWPMDSFAHERTKTRFGWVYAYEVRKYNPEDAVVEVLPHDHALREAIRVLPGLDHGNLVWNTDTDPVEFLNKYGEVLGDMLKYYKKKEAKLEKIANALEVLYDV